MPATFSVRKGNHSVHVCGKGRLIVGLGNPLHRVRSAVAGGDHSNIVPSTDTSVVPLVAEERGCVCRRYGQSNFGIRNLVGKAEFLEGHVMRVHMRSGEDICLCTTHNLPVSN